MKKIFYCELILILAFFISSCCYGGSSSSTSTTPSDSFSIGDEAILDYGSSNFAFVATDKDSFDKLIKACVAKDEFRVKEMIAAGKAFAVVDNPKVKILEMNFAGKKIRILEENQSGKAGWVPTEWVVKK